MQVKLRWLVQVLVFIVIVTVGGFLRTGAFNRPVPCVREVADVWAATYYGEDLSKGAWYGPLMARRTPFHVFAGYCAAFVGEREEGHSLRCYRLFPTLCALLVVGLIPLLGLRRRGGLFDAADGPLWTMGFVALSPVLIWQALSFNVFSFSVLLFLGLLLTARAYAQWPGFLSAIGIGALMALLVSVQSDGVWLVLVLVPSVIVGVGWTRLCLYWQTWHVLTTVLVGGALTALSVLLGFWQMPALPTLPPVQLSLLGLLWQRIGWLCMGGLGLLAWCTLAVYGGFRPERRWTRFFVVLFPACFMGSLFFVRGGIFAVALALLTPILVGMALSLVKNPWCRAPLGLVLAGTFFSYQLISWVPGPTSPVPHGSFSAEARRCLSEAVAAPHQHPFRLRIVSTHRGECALLAWLLRSDVDVAALEARQTFTDADILIVREEGLARVPKAIARRIRPGKVTLETGTQYRVFAEQPQN